MLYQTFPVGPLQVNCYILGCPDTGRAMVIEPGSEGGRILAALEAAELDLEMVVNTHGHFDHIGGNRELLAASPVPLLLHPADLPLLQEAASHASIYGLQVETSPEPTRLLQEGEQVEVGSLSFDVLHVPGHSPGSVCLFGHGHIFVGDVLFAGSIGRTDLPLGDHQQLIDGIRQKLFLLPDETRVCSGHGPTTTLGQEKRTNPFCGL